MVMSATRSKRLILSGYNFSFLVKRNGLLSTSDDGDGLHRWHGTHFPQEYQHKQGSAGRPYHFCSFCCRTRRVERTLCVVRVQNCVPIQANNRLWMTHRRNSTSETTQTRPIIFVDFGRSRLRKKSTSKGVDLGRSRLRKESTSQGVDFARTHGFAP